MGSLHACEHGLVQAHEKRLHARQIILYCLGFVLSEGSELFGPIMALSSRFYELEDELTQQVQNAFHRPLSSVRVLHTRKVVLQLFHYDV